MKKRARPDSQQTETGDSCPLFYARAGRVIVASAYGEAPLECSCSTVRDELDIDAHGFLERGAAQ